MQRAVSILSLSLLGLCLSFTCHAGELPLSWKQEVGFQKLVKSGEDAVFVAAANGFLYALRYDDGMKLWRFHLGKMAASRPVVTKDSITVVKDLDNLVNLSKENGAENWSYQAAAAITAGPVISGGLCYFGLKDGTVVAVSRWDGKLKWSFKTGGKVVALPLAAGTDLYVGSKDKHFYALDARKGELRWKFKSEGIVTAGAAADKTRVYFSSWDGTLHALDRKSGEPAGSAKLKEYCESLPLVLHEGKLYLYTIENRLLALAAEDFREIASLKVEGLAMAPVIREKELFLFTSDLQVYDAGTLARKRGYNELSEKAYQKEVKRKKLEARGKFSADDELEIKRFFPRLDSPICFAELGDGWVLFATEKGEIYLLGLPGLDWKWRAEVGAEIVTGLLARGETIFLGDARGYLRALDSFHGGLKWKIDLEASLVDLVEGGGMFYVTTTGQRLYAVDPETGRVRWYFKSGGDIKSRPTYSEGMVIFGASDGKLYLVDVKKGDGRYAAVDMGGEALTSPLVIGRDIIVAAAGVGLRCYTPAAGKVGLKWEYKCRNVLPACLAGNEEVTVLATVSSELILLNSSDGSLIWSQDLPRRLNSPLLLLSGRVAFIDGFNKLRLFTLVGGKELWSVELGCEPLLGPLRSGDYLELLLEKGRLVDYDMSGRIAAERQIRPGEVSGLLRMGGKLFCALRQGELVAYELAED